MSTIKPGGALVQLPRELRDKVYGHCLNKSYVVFWCYYGRRDFTHPIVDLAIFRVSKAISSEAKQVIFSRAASEATTFVFNIAFYLNMSFSTPPNKDATDAMMNIKFSIDLNSEDMQVRAEQRDQSETILPIFSMKSICEATVDRFAGTTVIRDNFRIRLYPRGRKTGEELEVFMRSHFFQTVKRFNGFRKAVAELKWRFLREKDVNSETQKEARTVQIRALQMELEPSLGPSDMESVVDHNDPLGGDHVNLTLKLEFHPLKFHVEKLRAEATRLTKALEG